MALCNFGWEWLIILGVRFYPDDGFLGPAPMIKGLLQRKLPENQTLECQKTQSDAKIQTKPAPPSFSLAWKPPRWA